MVVSDGSGMAEESLKIVGDPEKMGPLSGPKFTKKVVMTWACAEIPMATSIAKVSRNDFIVIFC